MKRYRCYKRYSLNPSLHRYTENLMSALFRRIQPAKKFRITKRQIAKFLRIPKSMIVNVQCWCYVIFVHRKDRGGQFISYRQMEQWKNAIAFHLQQCSTKDQLQQLWSAIAFDHAKYWKQYPAYVLPFLQRITRDLFLPRIPHDSERCPIIRMG